jgi:hypothetical protein
MAASFPQPFASIVIPSSEHGDPDTVTNSLTLARQDFARGEIREALRHLRRAAEGASDAGSEQRALALARAAADLATAVGPSHPPTSATSSVLPAASHGSGPRSSLDPTLRELLEKGRAVKVIVKRSTRDDELYVVRRADGANASLGGKEAVIVLLEPDDDFFDPR